MSRLKITNARRKQRVRLSLRRTANGRPRLSVFRSSKHIYAQVIDDVKGETLASASSLEKAFRVRAPRLVGGRVALLVDDVMTTGSTADEIARVLLDGAARGVKVLTLARAMNEFSV